MTEAYLILRDFGNRVAEVHLSEVNAASKHEPISYGATLAYQQVASLIPETIPVILESIVSAEFIDDEIEARTRPWRQAVPGRGCEGGGQARWPGWFTRSSPPALAVGVLPAGSMPGQPPRPGGGLELRPKRIVDGSRRLERFRDVRCEDHDIRCRGRNAQRIFHGRPPRNHTRAASRRCPAYAF